MHSFVGLFAEGAVGVSLFIIGAVGEIYMNINILVYMYVFIHVYILWICICVFISISLSMFTHSWMYVCMYISTCEEEAVGVSLFIIGVVGEAHINSCVFMCIYANI
jgi:hypothetical protein